MYTTDGRIRYSECDESGALSLLSLINYFQDCSTFHSEDLCRGVSGMRERRLAWLIAAWQIRIRHLPRFCDRISVSTWCHGMTHTLAARNFLMSDARGRTLVEADSLWFVYDATAGRPIRIPDDQRIYLSDDAPLDLPPTVRRLPVEGPFEAAPELVVGAQHLDTNRHVNNAQYLGMATDAVAALHGVHACPTDALDTICIQYKRQARLGEVIVPRVSLRRRSCTVELAAADGGESYAVVRLSYPYER